MRTRFGMIAVICTLGIALASCHGDSDTLHDGGVFSPLALYDKTNNHYIALYHRRLFGDDRNKRVYGQRINADSALVGSEFAITSDTGDKNSRCFAAAYDDQDQRIFVAWTSSGQVYGQIVNADGTLFGNDFVIGDSAACPVVAYDSVNATFLVSWADTTTTVAVLARRFSPDGAPDSGQKMISNNLFLRYSFSDGPVSIAYDPDTQQHLIVMRDGQNLSAQALISDGTPTGAAVTLTTTGDLGDRAIALYDGVNKRYLVTWADQDRLRGQYMNPDGTVLGASFAMSGANPSLGRRHGLAFDAADNRFLEVYSSSWYCDNRVFGQMLNEDVALTTLLPGSQFTISPSEFPGAFRPSVVFNTLDRKFLVLWQYGREFDDDRDNRYPDIHGQVINADGTMDNGIFVAAVGGQ